MMDFDLPDVVPVFPLTGVLLLPRTFLPLHVFEPRYRAMVEDALETDGKLIGMIQPFAPREDNRPDPEAPPETPDLYTIGCAGHIVQAERLDDGRWVLLLQGVTRFRVETEVDERRGYRRVRVRFDEFEDDLEDREEAIEQGTIDRQTLLDEMVAYGAAQGLEIDPEHLVSLTDEQLVNGLCASLPFEPAEKQALLEAPSLEDRQTLLRSLLAMGTPTGPVPPGDPSPAAN